MFTTQIQRLLLLEIMSYGYGVSKFWYFIEINFNFLLFQGQPGYGGGYGGHPGGGFPGAPAVNPETQAIFSKVDKDGSGKITADELKTALVNGKGQNFSDHACLLMISMFDGDKSGTIGVVEFERLYNYINQWLNCFKTYDRDSSGAIEEPELFQALSQVSRTEKLFSRSYW